MPTIFLFVTTFADPTRRDRHPPWYENVLPPGYVRSIHKSCHVRVFSSLTSAQAAVNGHLEPADRVHLAGGAWCDADYSILPSRRALWFKAAGADTYDPGIATVYEVDAPDELSDHVFLYTDRWSEEFQGNIEVFSDDSMYDEEYKIQLFGTLRAAQDKGGEDLAGILETYNESCEVWEHLTKGDNPFIVEQPTNLAWSETEPWTLRHATVKDHDFFDAKIVRLPVFA